MRVRDHAGWAADQHGGGCRLMYAVGIIVSSAWQKSQKLAVNVVTRGSGLRRF